MNLPIWITTYYVVAFILAVYFILKAFRISVHSVLFTLIAFGGPINFFVPEGDKYMKVVTTAITLYIFCHDRLWIYVTKYIWLWMSFVLYSSWFLIDALVLHQDGLVFTLAQYSKVLIPFVFLFAFLKMRDTKPELLQQFNHLIATILIVQIGMSVFRYALNGFHYWEGMVGTFGGVRGGGAGTGFPLAALCWVALNSNMNIKGWKSWLFLIGLLMIGIATGKRAVILLFPILYFVFSIFVSKKKYRIGTLVTLALTPIILVLGVKLTPSLNPDNKVWGRFDIDYAINYVQWYSGIESVQQTNIKQVPYLNKKEVYEGRIGCVRLFWSLFSDYNNYTNETWVGTGPQRIYAADADLYRDSEYNFGVDHRGSMTGIFMHFKALGTIGVLLFLLYYCQMFSFPKYKKFGFVLLGVSLFDFVFYNTTIIREPMVAIMISFCLIYADMQYSKKGEYIGVTHKLFK